MDSYRCKKPAHWHTAPGSDTANCYIRPYLEAVSRSSISVGGQYTFCRYPSMTKLKDSLMVISWQWAHARNKSPRYQVFTFQKSNKVKTWIVLKKKKKKNTEHISLFLKNIFLFENKTHNHNMFLSVFGEPTCTCTCFTELSDVASVTLLGPYLFHRTLLCSLCYTDICCCYYSRWYIDRGRYRSLRHTDLGCYTWA